MYDENGEPHYPLDSWLGFRKKQYYSPLVEIKVAELASDSTYRESSRILREWTAVNISHTTVGTIIRRVGEAQAVADKDMVMDLEYAAELPKGKKEVDYLYAEADGVFVREVQKKKHIEVSYGIMYEGWRKNGKRVSLENPKVIMTTKSVDEFWEEMKAFAANEYALEDTQVVSNSDGGAGYSADRFKEVFAQSNPPLLHQLDEYHIQQSINRTFGYRKNEWKDKIREAIRNYDFDKFTLILDTYESQLECDEEIENVTKFRTYILNHWGYIPDSRNRVDRYRKAARGLGGMESKQRRVTFRMKRRGMHWSRLGAEAMVKIKQGIANNTLRDVYLAAQHRSHRKQHDV